MSMTYVASAIGTPHEHLPITVADTALAAVVDEELERGPSCGVPSSRQTREASP